MWLNLGKIFHRLSEDSNVRSILLTGSGDRAFTSGLDVQAASSSGPLSPTNSKGDPARTALGVRTHILEFQSAITAVESCSKPVIVLLHGISFGLAIDLSCAADIRIASKDARMCVKEVDIGLAADIGTLSRLPKVVGSGSWVKEVCLSAREFGADEAMRVGFVSQVVNDKADGVEKGLALAKLIAEKSPVAVLGTKELLNYSRDHTVLEGMFLFLPHSVGTNFLATSCFAWSLERGTQRFLLLLPIHCGFSSDFR